MNIYASIRERTGLSQELFARILGVRPVTLVRLEHGEFEDLPDVRDAIQKKMNRALHEYASRDNS